MPRYEYAGPAPHQHDGELVRPGDVREFDEQPGWGAWRNLDAPAGAAAPAADEPPAAAAPAAAAPAADKPAPPAGAAAPAADGYSDKF